MKKRTRWILGAVLALILIGGSVVAFAPDSAMGKIISGTFIAAAAVAVWSLKQMKAGIQALAGSVTGKGDTFVPVDGDPNRIDVWAGGEAHRVTLPAGMTSGKVRAVKVAEGGAVTVEILP